MYLDGVVFDLQKSGGISIYFSELVTKLNKEKIPHKLIDIQKSNNKCLREYGINWKSKKVLIPRSISRYMDVNVSPECSIFHSSYYRLPKKKYRNTCVVITTVHDFAYEKFVKGWRQKLHFWQKKRAILKSDVLICISQSTYDDMVQLIPESVTKDVRIIHNGCSDDFKPLHQSENKCSNNILFIGARGRYKNFESVVNALSLSDKYTLLVVGGGRLEDSERHLLESKLRNRFHKLDFISNKELNKLYNEAHCLVYPSLYEGFGIPVIEAMKAGCPVIACNTSSIPEVAGGKAILLDKLSPEELYKAIVLLESSNLRSSMVFGGIQNGSRFSWDNTFEKVIKIYKESTF